MSVRVVCVLYIDFIYKKLVFVRVISYDWNLSVVELQVVLHCSDCLILNKGNLHIYI